MAAFRATLEEVLEADVIAHVRDAAHAESEAQKADVLAVLAELGIDVEGERPIVEILNKIDLLEPAARNGLLARNAAAPDGPVAISALTGEGLPALLARLERALNVAQVELAVNLDPTDGAGLAWLYQHARVLERRDGRDAIAMVVAADPQNAERIVRKLRPRTRLFQSDRPSA